MNYRAILEKADLAFADLTANGGILKPMQAQWFIRLLIEQSVFMQLATIVSMRSPKQKISKIKSGSYIRRPDQKATTPDLLQVELKTELFKAELCLSDEELWNIIKHDKPYRAIMKMMAKVVSRDMEEMLVNGVLKQATSNVVDAAGSPISADLLRDLMEKMPIKHLHYRHMLRYLTSVGADFNYRKTIGDKFLRDDVPVFYWGVPLQPIPLFPENLGASNNQTAILLCNPRNIHVGIWRQIRIETSRDISKGTLKIVATLYVGVKFAEESGVAKAINIQL